MISLKHPAECTATSHRSLTPTRNHSIEKNILWRNRLILVFKPWEFKQKFTFMFVLKGEKN